MTAQGLPRREHLHKGRVEGARSACILQGLGRPVQPQQGGSTVGPQDVAAGAALEGGRVRICCLQPGASATSQL